MAIWEQNQGCGDRPESDAQFERFRQFLNMGEGRNITRLAAVLGVSQQALSRLAVRKNWRERAHAWDHRNDPPLPQNQQQAKPPKSSVPPPPPPPPPPAVTDRPIEPQVLGKIAAGSSKTSLTHRQSLSRYRTVYESIGYGMAVEAGTVFGIAKRMLTSIDRAVEASERLHEAGQPQEALQMLASMEGSVRTYLNLCNVMHGYANGGRMHWGDAIGVHRILEAAFGNQSRKPGSS